MNNDITNLAGASPVDQPVRPRAWLWTDINGDTQVNLWEAPQGSCEPLYDQAAVDTLVNQYADDERYRAERRWASRVDGLTAQIRELDARYMALLKEVADGVMVAPRTVVLSLPPNQESNDQTLSRKES